MGPIVPYIQTDRRIKASTHPVTPGELNFAFTDLIVGYLRFKGLRYETLNDIMGALEGAKAEFIFRVVRDYEDKKCRENGDVYLLPEGL